MFAIMDDLYIQKSMVMFILSLFMMFDFISENNSNELSDTGKETLIELCGIESSIAEKSFRIDQRMFGKEVLECRD